MSTEYNLNVSARYVTGWSSWEVVREIITNAMDADAGWELIRHASDSITIFTSTVPRLGDMIVIGQGTKTADDDNIGQFGEGLKLAALACCRAQGSFRIVTPTGTVHFFLKNMLELDADVLHCRVDRDGEHSTDGTYVHISMIACGEVSPQRFLRDRSEKRLEKIERSHLNVFLKGVWVKRMELHSLYDWNASKARINRDRSMVDMLHLESEVCHWYEETINNADCREMLENPMCFEVKCMGFNYWAPSNVKSMMAKAFYEIHGEKVCLPSKKQQANEYAMLKGYSVIGSGSDNLDRILSGNVKNADDIVPKDVSEIKLKELEIQNCTHKYLDETRELLDRMNCPVRIRIFKEAPDVMNQHGHLCDDRFDTTIWLKESCLDNRMTLLSTLFSFLSSARNKFPGISLAFEGTIATMCAKIGEAWIEDHSQCPS